MIGGTNMNYKIIPGTEENLMIENDNHRFDENPNLDSLVMHNVLVDGFSAKAGVGYFGTFSERISLIFESPHPQLGEYFTTKYFIFDNKIPGKVNWGHDEQSFKIEKIVQ
jgi:hypothetical protein